MYSYCTLVSFEMTPQVTCFPFFQSSWICPLRPQNKTFFEMYAHFPTRALDNLHISFLLMYWSLIITSTKSTSTDLWSTWNTFSKVKNFNLKMPSVFVGVGGEVAGQVAQSPDSTINQLNWSTKKSYGGGGGSGINTQHNKWFEKKFGILHVGIQAEEVYWLLWDPHFYTLTPPRMSNLRSPNTTEHCEN